MEAGRFVWRDLLTRDVSAAKRFYEELLGWRFEETTRADRPYVLARSGGMLVAGIVDVSANADAAPQWLSYMAVADVDKTAAQVRADGGKILVEPMNVPIARVAAVADPQGAPLGLAQLRRDIPEPAQATAGQFFWQDTSLETRRKRSASTNVSPGTSRRLASRAWASSTTFSGRLAVAAVSSRYRQQQTFVPTGCLMYLVDDPATLSTRVASLGGRILVPAAPERRNGSLVVIADPGGAPLALQKYPF